MSAPDTELEKQTKRHRWSLGGIVAGLVIVVIVAIAAFVWPGMPLDQQAAPDGAPSETTEGDAVTGGPSIVVDNDENTTAEETQ